MSEKPTFKTHGFKSLSNFGGIEIMLSDTNSCEAVKVRFYGDCNNRWHRIYYNLSGVPYFRFRGRRWRLDEFMRV